MILAVLVAAAALAACGDDDGPAGNGSPTADAALLQPGDSILAIDLDPGESSYPFAESPANAIDNNVGSKYLNFGEVNSGFIVTPSFGSSTIKSFVITTANDALQRDPTAYALYGTNDMITSADNSSATDEDWTLIDSGALALPDARQVEGPRVPVSGFGRFTSYLFVVTAVKDEAFANSMQFSEIQFYGH
jgi:hypothetical protein